MMSLQRVVGFLDLKLFTYSVIHFGHLGFSISHRGNGNEERLNGINNSILIILYIIYILYIILNLYLVDSQNVNVQSE